LGSALDVDKEVTEIIVDAVKSMNRAWEMSRAARQEILILFASGKSFARQDRAGGGQFLKGLTTKTSGLKIKILAPKNERVEELRSELKPYNIEVKYIQEFSQTKISMLIADRKTSIVIELKDDNAIDTLDAIGQSTYSTRSLTVLSYVSIFESYWTLSELHEESENELAYTKEYLNKVLNELDSQKK
jgi:two-component system, OmpR family, sensor histidine kinase VicK